MANFSSTAALAAARLEAAGERGDLAGPAELYGRLVAEIDGLHAALGRGAASGKSNLVFIGFT